MAAANLPPARAACPIPDPGFCTAAGYAPAASSDVGVPFDLIGGAERLFDWGKKKVGQLKSEMIDSIFANGPSGDASSIGITELGSSANILKNLSRSAWIFGGVFMIGQSFDREFGEGDAHGRSFPEQFGRGAIRSFAEVGGSYVGGLGGGVVGGLGGAAIGSVADGVGAAPGAAVGTFVGGGLGSYAGAGLGDQLFDEFFGP